MIANNDSAPPAHRFRTRPIAPQPLSIADSQKQLDTHVAAGLVLAPAQEEAATKALLLCCSLLGQPVTLKPVSFLANPNPSYEERKAQEMVSRRLLPKLPSFSDGRIQFSAALAEAPKPLSKTIDGQLRQSLAAITSMFSVAKANRELEVVAKINAAAAQAQADADSRSRVEFEAAQRAKARKLKLASLAEEERKDRELVGQRTQ